MRFKSIPLQFHLGSFRPHEVQIATAAATNLSGSEAPRCDQTFLQHKLGRVKLRDIFYKDFTG